MTNEIVLSPAAELQPASLFTPTRKAAQRVLEFFTAQINNDHTRKALTLQLLHEGGNVEGLHAGELADAARVAPFREKRWQGA